MNIIPVIRDLLLHHQRAVVPGLGSFVLSQRPAQLNRVTGVLTPPTYTVRFDRTPQDDDGQLTGYLTRKLGLNKSEALKAINDFAKEANEKLNNLHPVKLEGFGTLLKKANGEITFAVEDELLKRISLFEMPKLEVPPVTKKTEPVQSKVRPEKPVAASPVTTQPVTPKSRRKWVIPVVLLGLLIGMLVVIYVTGNMGMLVSDIKSVFVSQPKDSTRQMVFGNDATDTINNQDTLTSQISKELDSQVDRSKALSIDEPENVPAENKIVTEQPVTGTPEVSYARAYHIVAGSFTVLANAEKQRALLQSKGLNAEILPKKGSYYMVSLGSFDTSGEAATERDQLQKRAGLELWVMKTSPPAPSPSRRGEELKQ